MEKKVRVVRLPLAEDKLSYFRFGDVGDKKIVTNDAGAFHLMGQQAFEDFLGGRIGADHPEHRPLSEKGFLREGLDLARFAGQIRRKKRFVGVGPHLHIVITTLRCNQSCKYCHASRTNMDRVDTDMSLETAKRVVDHALSTTSPYVNFEFQGGEPTVNMPALKFIVEYSREKNKYEKKDLEHSLVTNMTYMTEENAEWLIDNDVMVCTSLDGPEELHNWNRTWRQGSNAYASVRKWIAYFNQRYIDKGRDPQRWHVDALMTTSRKTFDHWREVVDLYIELGMRTIFLRPLNPYGFALDTWKRIGYTPDEYLAFYRNAFDYILEKNLAGIEICEGTAATFLSKMLTADDPNFVDIRSPCGAGTGQVAYNYDGKIFTCDEARMTGAMGNDAFQIGQVGVTSYEDAQSHPTVKALATASLQDSLPHCESCWNKPFCGVCPMHSYMTHGDIFGQRPNSSKCKEHYTIASMLLDRLGNDPDGKIERIFRRWTMTRPREPSGSCAV